MIETTYTVTREEWAEAQDIWAARRSKKVPGTKLLKYLSVFLGICVGLSVHFLPYWLTAMYCVYLLASLAFSSWRKKAVRRYLYDQATDRNQSTDLRIDESGYTSIRPGFNECRMSWKCFTGWREGDVVFVLGRGVQFCIVPKQSLSSDQQSELRNLLKAHLEVA